MEPPKRPSSEADGKAWLDTVVGAYAQRSDISLSSGGSSGGGGDGAGGAMINSENFLRFKVEQDRFAAQQIKLYVRYLNRDSRAGEIAHNKEKATSAQLQARLDSITREHGDTYIDGIQPTFDPRKARHFDSSWNWVRQDAFAYVLRHHPQPPYNRRQKKRYIVMIESHLQIKSTMTMHDNGKISP